MAGGFYLRKDLYVKAIMWNGTNMRKVQELLGWRVQMELLSDYRLQIEYMNKKMVAKPLDYVMREGKEIKVMKANDFDKIFTKM